MIRFLRNLIITVILIAALLWIAAWFFREKIIDRVEPPITAKVVKIYNPGDNDKYSYEAGLHFWPATVEIKNLKIDAVKLTVDGNEFHDCILEIDKITCDLLPLVRYDEVVILDISGRKFSGLITLDELAKRIERTGGTISNVRIDMYNGKARIQARFGSVSVYDITVFGTWAIDVRGVATLVDKTYYNPDSSVPAGAIEIIENQSNFDIRIKIADEELIADEVRFSPEGLWYSGHD
ncbi:MAG: hypothetical protein ABIC40_08675 [bacterium]